MAFATLALLVTVLLVHGLVLEMLLLLQQVLQVLGQKVLMQVG